MLNGLKSSLVTLMLFAAIAYGAVMKIDEKAILDQVNTFISLVQNNFKGSINIEELIKKFKQDGFK